MKKSIIPILASLALLGACKKDLVEKYNQNGQNPDINASVSNMNDLKVPEGFNWATTRVYDLNIVLKSADDKAVTNTLVKFMNDGYENKGATLLKTATDEEGRIQAKLMLPSSMKQLVLNTSYLGLPKDIVIDLTNETINLELGGTNSAPINTVPSKMPSPVVLGKSSSNKFNVVPSSRTWNSSGVPNYKEATNDVVSQSLLANIASALPESVQLPSNSPMLSDAAVRVIRVRELADVYVTFVSEGAGYRNVLFYYTYNENNPPASKSAIDKYTVIFPNTSLNGSGGGLASGNKVFLGRFPAGTVIGYGVAADGWKGGSQGFNGVTEGNWLVFADKNLNPESNVNLRQHMVLLNDVANHRFIMGFEDIRRDDQGCDHDFNDVLFYTTSNPVTAINDDNVTPLPQKEDQDKDGVSDSDDDYPTDANKAFNNPTGTGSVAFEDQWPSTGDYDLNDVVMNYNYNVVTNAQNKVVRVEGTLTLRATGGAFVNGFGVQFPVERSKVSGVTGANLEAGQSKAVLILFENMRNEMTAWNTVRGATTSQEKTYNIAFNVSNGPSLSTFGLGVYNPFIWNGSMGRGYEIHLVNQLPTDLATTSVFGTNRDGSNLSSGSTYVSKNNRLPWAIHTPANFSYPVEKADINTAYLKFAAWVQSGGSLFTDWYSNGTGYRNNENIY